MVEAAELFDDRLFVAFPPGTPEPPATVTPAAIDEERLLLLEDGHCLKEHALAACNRPELRAEAAMMGTSLHTLVQMVDNGLGMTMVPQMAIDAGILDGTAVIARPLDAEHPSRLIALIWRKNSPREKEFRLLADALREAA
jgi:LysR family hydrogen peroxide-inducible transcriptional activator